MTSTLTSTYTRSPAASSLNLQTRSLPISFNRISTATTSVGTIRQTFKFDDNDLTSDFDTQVDIKYRNYGNSCL